MSLVGRLGLSRETLLDEGTPDEVMEKKRRAYEEKARVSLSTSSSCEAITAPREPARAADAPTD